jgi:hypothetical protein
VTAARTTTTRTATISRQARVVMSVTTRAVAASGIPASQPPPIRHRVARLSFLRPRTRPAIWLVLEPALSPRPLVPKPPVPVLPVWARQNRHTRNPKAVTPRVGYELFRQAHPVSRDIVCQPLGPHPHAIGQVFGPQDRAPTPDATLRPTAVLNVLRSLTQVADNPPAPTELPRPTHQSLGVRQPVIILRVPVADRD